MAPTSKQLVMAEHNVHRAGRSETGMSSPRYRGAFMCKTLFVKMAMFIQSIVGCGPAKANECISVVVHKSHMGKV